ncbi:MAG: hypothetical protein ACPKQO_02180 [Nitrososphaeraceae archaeon]
MLQLKGIIKFIIMIIVIRYNMIGDLFYEATGKITNQRVLDTTGPKLEASFTAYGNWNFLEYSSSKWKSIWLR